MNNYLDTPKVEPDLSSGDADYRAVTDETSTDRTSQRITIKIFGLAGTKGSTVITHRGSRLGRVMDTLCQHHSLKRENVWSSFGGNRLMNNDTPDQQLGLLPSVDRTLLHGVGCAGGLAIMRTAAQIACGATIRGRPARILCFACELSIPNVRYEVDAAAKCLDASQVCIAGALFSDAAAAFILCNDLGLQKSSVKPIYELLEWINTLVPDTSNDLEFFVEATGYHETLSRSRPKHAVAAVEQMVQSLLPSIRARASDDLGLADCDWALHPGGQATIDGVQRTTGLADERLRATREIYRTRGNSSSPTMLAVLDGLRCIDTGKGFVIATPFGPGLSVEMSFLRSCSIQPT